MALRIFNPGDWRVVGAGRRSLVLQNTEGEHFFISTKAYASLMMDHGMYFIHTRPSHEDPNTGKHYPESKWIGYYKPVLF